MWGVVDKWFYQKCASGTSWTLAERRERAEIFIQTKKDAGVVVCRLEWDEMLRDEWETMSDDYTDTQKVPPHILLTEFEMKRTFSGVYFFSWLQVMYFGLYTALDVEVSCWEESMNMRVGDLWMKLLGVQFRLSGFSRFNLGFWVIRFLLFLFCFFLVEVFSFNVCWVIHSMK